MSDFDETMKLLLAGKLKTEDLFKPSSTPTPAKTAPVSASPPNIRVGRPAPVRPKKIHIPKWLQAYKR